MGPQGPKGDTGTVDTSSFYDKPQSDGRFVQLNPAARQDPPATALGAASLWLRPAVAQSGTPTAELKALNDGGLLATGTFGVGQIPASGCGMRTMWYPAKGAFRSGSAQACPATAAQWNDANVGDFSWAGGNETVASAYGTFAFGDQSVASSTVATAIGSANTRSGTASLSVGASNKAEGFASTALGFTNRATGQGSVALGYRVGAIGDYSVALGHRAVTAPGCPTSSTCDLSTINAGNGYTGAFVFGDQSTTTSVAATANNQFTARAAGGFRFFTNSTLTTGCTLPPGSGTFNCTSDRNAKHAFQPVDGQDVLQRLTKVPVTTWQYKSEKGGLRHMGPTAQDFRRAFGLGTDDKTISTLDEAGVNLAAIKALHETTQRQDRRIADQDREIRELKTQVAALVRDRR